MSVTPDEIQSLKETVFNKPVDNPNPTNQPTDSTATSVTDSPPADNPEKKDVVEFDEPIYLKNNFGWDSVEIAKKELEELRKLKETPAPSVETLFDEDGKKIVYSYLKEGKDDELFNHLHGKRLLKDLDSKTPEEKLKLYIRLQNPDFDQELIDYKFGSLYTLDESLFTDEETNEKDPLKERLAKAELQQRLRSDVEKANEYFGQYKKNITLPELTSNPEIDKQKQFIADYQKFIEEDKKEQERLSLAASTVTETDATFKTTFEDKDNKGLVFEVSIVPDKEDLEVARKAAADIGTFLDENYKNKDGSLLIKELVQDLLFARNKVKYAQSVSKQATFEAIKWHLGQNKPNLNGTSRNYAIDTTPSEIENYRQSVFGKKTA